MTTQRIKKRQLYGVMLGNFCEHYDSALFGMLSPFIAPLFFPNEEPLYQLIYTYAMIPFGMLARPIGALVIGYFGDAYGRKHALAISLIGMAVLSLIIAMVPTYASVGIWAAVLMSLLRLGQNFFSAGEMVGGAVSVLEMSAPEKRDWISSIYCGSTMGGIVLASGAVALLGLTGTVEWSWRSLYVLGGVTGLIGLYLRRNLVETCEPTSNSFRERTQALWRHREAALYMAIASGFSYACYQMALGFVNGLIPIITGIDRSTIMSMNTGLLVIDFAMLPLCGILSYRIGRERVMLASSLAALVLAVPLFAMMKGASLWQVAILRIGLVSLGVAFSAVYHAWAQSLVPTKDRFLVCAVSYAVGCQLLGSPTASLSLWIYGVTGEVTTVAWYWMALAGAASVAVWRSRALLVPEHRSLATPS
ncbi:MAG: MFS transporter [Chlamydiia bacterium]|nr:MFS transporter [Chlamydiia bacterium]